MKRLLTTLLAVGALAASSLTFSASLPMLHSAATGNNYIAYTDLKTYSQADSYCNVKQGHLAVINSTSEANDLKAYLHTTSGTYWLGETLAGYQGTYVTVTNQAYVFPQGITETGLPFPGDTSLFYYQFITSSSGDILNWTIAGGTAYFVCEFEDAPI